MTANPVAIALVLVLHERHPADLLILDEVDPDLPEVLLALLLLLYLHVGRPADDHHLVGGDLLILEVEVEVLLLLAVNHLVEGDLVVLDEVLLALLLLLLGLPHLLAVAPGPGRAGGYLVLRVVAPGND